jgi:hypothetical protein
MFTIDVALTVGQAISVMRAIAAKEWMEPDVSKRDDLEMIRLAIYERVYHCQPQTIGMDMGHLTGLTKHNRQQFRVPDGHRGLASANNTWTRPATTILPRPEKPCLRTAA